MNKAEEKVSKFYNQKGWETKSGVIEDAKRFGGRFKTSL